MRKIFFYFFSLQWALQSFPVSAQTGVSVMNMLINEKEIFLHNLAGITADTSINYPLARYFETGINEIYSSLESNPALSVIEKEKAARSLVYFMQELHKNIKERRSAVYEIPGTIRSYNNVQKALLKHKPILPVLKVMNARSSQLMAASFSQYQEYALLDDISVYKRVASSPEYILQFLENKPRFRFADSLLLEAAAYDPVKIIYYLHRDKPGIQNMIRQNPNRYLKQIVALSDDKQASELLPFVALIAGHKMTPAEILEKRKDPLAYFQLLVNTLQEPGSATSAGIFFWQPLRNGIKQKALSFYANQVNELHSAADPERFASVKGLRPQDLYYIITSCGEELYTSSYLGLYKRLMEHFNEGPADSLFHIMGYDNFRIFIRLAANYNVLGDFLLRLSPDKMKEILQRFIGDIESDENTALEKAMDIADSFSALDASPDINELIQSELKSNLIRCKSTQHFLGIRLYSILLDILDMVNQKDDISELWKKLGNYEVLERKALENGEGAITELVLFYGDEDGVASFANFSRTYADRSKWEISKTENWISIRSLAGEPLVIYANKPLDIEEEMDWKAQDSLMTFLKEHSLEPTILVHRGHSYHLEKTLKRLSPSVKLAILGSCGGYNKAISIASINADVQVIGSRKTGSKSINDPILDVINESLVNKEDLVWPEVWKKLEKRFMKDPGSLSLFNEYFPPDKNLGLFVLKLFNK